MYCLANNRCVCLEKKNNLNDINSSLSMNKDIIHIIDYLPCNLACWLKTMRILLICEKYCVRLRETCLFRKKCLKNSTQLQGYMMDKLITTPISNTANEADLLVQLNITHSDSNTKCKIRSEDEIYSFQWQPIIEAVNSEDSLVKEGIICKQEVDEKQNSNSTELIEESEDALVNLEVAKEENTWKREGIGDPTDNNSTVNMDNDSYSHCVSSEFTQVHATNKNHLNIASKKSFQCSNYCKSFFTKSVLILHSRIHTDEKIYECVIWKTRFSQKAKFIIHTRVHTHDGKSFNCSRCNKCFSATLNFVRHMRMHTGEKSYKNVLL